MFEFDGVVWCGSVLSQLSSIQMCDVVVNVKVCNFATESIKKRRGGGTFYHQ